MERAETEDPGGRGGGRKWARARWAGGKRQRRGNRPTPGASPMQANSSPPHPTHARTAQCPLSLPLSPSTSSTTPPATSTPTSPATSTPPFQLFLHWRGGWGAWRPGRFRARCWRACFTSMGKEVRGLVRKRATHARTLARMRARPHACAHEHTPARAVARSARARTPPNIEIRYSVYFIHDTWTKGSDEITA